MASSADTASVWYPHYAVDLRSGSTYQNNAYLKGTLVAENANNSITINPNSNGTSSIVGKSNDTVAFTLGFDTVNNGVRGYYKTSSNEGTVKVTSLEKDLFNQTYFSGMQIQQSGNTTQFGSKGGKVNLSGTWPTNNQVAAPGDIFLNEQGFLASNGAVGPAVQTVEASSTIQNINSTTGIVVANSNNMSIKLPTAGLYYGRIIWVKKILGNGSCSVYDVNGTTLIGAVSENAPQIFVCDGTNWH